MSHEDAAIVPALSHPPPSIHPTHAPTSSPTSPISASLASEDDDNTLSSTRATTRPKLGSRKTSRTLIVPADTPEGFIIDDDDELDEHGRSGAMSPPRSSGEVTRLGEEARRDLIQQAQTLQLSLQAIVERVEEVKQEHEKLEGGNKFLQSYIGELMSTSKITSSAPKTKGKGRSGK